MVVQFSLEIKSKISPKHSLYGVKNLKEINKEKFMGFVQAFMVINRKAKVF